MSTLFCFVFGFCPPHWFLAVASSGSKSKLTTRTALHHAVQARGTETHSSVRLPALLSRDKLCILTHIDTHTHTLKNIHEGKRPPQTHSLIHSSGETYNRTLFVEENNNSNNHPQRQRQSPSSTTTTTSDVNTRANNIQL